MPGARSFFDPRQLSFPTEQSQDLARTKQTQLPHQLLPRHLPFEEEAFSGACLMSTACHAQTGCYSLKSTYIELFSLLCTSSP